MRNAGETDLYAELYNRLYRAAIFSLAIDHAFALTPLTTRASSWSPALLLLLLLLVSSCQALTSAVVILPREYLDPYYAAAAVDLLQTSSPWPASCM